MVLKLGDFVKVEQKYLESFEMWRWRRRRSFSWTDRVKGRSVTYIKGGEKG